MDRFLQNLYEFVPEENYFLIWAYDNIKMKKSYWFNDYEEAAKVISNIKNDGLNIYCGGGLSPEDYGPNKRCMKSEISGLVGLYADIDIRDNKAHSKKNLPKDMSEAMKILESTPYPPTVIIHSGHGLQAWWLFNEPMMFEEKEDRSKAENISKRFNYYLKGIAERLGKEAGVHEGWEVDSVYNLDRVLRVPGTINNKSEPIPVKVVEENYEQRYEPSFFDDSLPELEDFDTDTIDYTDKIVKGSIELNASANPAFDKFNSLMNKEPNFKKSWDRTRKDLSDQSASSYDLSLANYAALDNWTEQEIADLIIASRRFHKDDLKLRMDYYKRTIGIALSTAEKYKADNELEELAKDDIIGETLNNDRKEAILQTISSLFEIRIIQIIKYLSEPPTYKIVTEKGDVNIGDVDNLIVQRKLRSHLASTTGKYLPRIKAGKWDTIAQNLLNACEEVELSEEATESGQTKVWLRSYVVDNMIYNIDEEEDTEYENMIEDLLLSKMPFDSDGKRYIFLETFKKWIRVNEMEKVSSKKLATLLRSIGCEAEKKAFKTPDGWKTRNVWRIVED